MAWLCVPSTCLPGPGEESLPTSFLDTLQSALSKSRNIPSEFCYSGSLTEFFRSFPSGTMLRHSTVTLGVDESISSAEDFLVKTSVQQGRDPASTAKDPACGVNSLASFVKYDRASFSWKTAQCSFLEDSEGFSEIWPRWGTLVNGACWERMIPALHTSERESGFLPTPLASDTTTRKKRFAQGGLPLSMAVDLWPTPTTGEVSKTPATRNYGQTGLNNHPRIRGELTRERFQKDSRSIGGEPIQQRQSQLRWPTPTTSDGKGSAHPGSCKDWEKRGTNLPEAVQKKRTWQTPTAGEGADCGSKWEALGRRDKGGRIQRQMATRKLTEDTERAKLNPDWVEWLMNWPIGWTRSEPLSSIDFAEWLEWSTGGGENFPSGWRVKTPRVLQDCPRRVVRLKAIGNGQVPACARMAFEILLLRLADRDLFT